MKKQIMARKVDKGEKLDCSANELYLHHIEQISAALARANFKKAIEQKLSIKTLWVSSGRSGEPAHLSLNGLSWNVLHDAGVIESFQSKPGKMKYVLLLAGKTRHSSWALDFGDMLIFDHGMATYTEGEQFWLLPDLGGASNAGTKLSNYIRALQPEGRPGSLKRYWEIGCDVPSLPIQSTAAGVRPGACETLCMATPAEYAVHNTGHDLTGIGALFEYLNGRISLALPGAVALFGWDPFPYGQNGKGPRHPSLSAIIAVPLEKLEVWMDSLFCFQTGGKHPPQYLVGGELRPLLHAAFASLIMFYEERFKANEAAHVLMRMRESYELVFSAREDAHNKILGFGRDIRCQFDHANLHMTDRHGHDLSEKVITCVKQLGSSVGSTHVQIADVTERVARIEGKLDQIVTLLSQLATTSTHPPPVTPSPSPSPPHPEQRLQLPLQLPLQQLPPPPCTIWWSRLASLALPQSLLPRILPPGCSW